MRPFYLYLMKFRQPKEIDEITKFANYAYEDHGFPKQSTDYNELSIYLELNADYLESMSVFDQAWEQYVQIEEGLILGDQE
ncbi:YozE family protein [Peribacillus frigoritolerans]|uniref:YozE family protein n=1 Tax=Peribacillus frigoritolerans TaxID=450367 RepID=UPI00207A9F71|nr:YozE family protein [Peribacillus frigoritolerans]USK62901.1 YozE family protein [Peribacillus frigoritolerans]